MPSTATATTGANRPARRSPPIRSTGGRKTWRPPTSAWPRAATGRPTHVCTPSPRISHDRGSGPAPPKRSGPQRLLRHLALDALDIPVHGQHLLVGHGLALGHFHIALVVLDRPGEGMER